MPDFLPPVDYTARDYLSIKAALTEHVQNFFPNDWSDFLESNLGVAILELVAYVGDQLSFYLDRIANEIYLPTAVQRENVINLVKLIGYTPRTATAATVPVQATLQLAQSDDVVVPAYTVLTDNDGTEYEFLENIEIEAGITDTVDQQVTDETLVTADGTTATYSLTLDNGNITVGSVTLSFTIQTTPFTVNVKNDGTISLPFGGTGSFDYDDGSMILNFDSSRVPDNTTAISATYQWSQEISAYQGRTHVDAFSSDGSANQRFTLSRRPVLVHARVPDEEVTPDPSRFEVWEGDPGAPFGTATGSKWTRVDALVQAGPTEEVYEVTIDNSDRVTIRFGDNTAGKIPPAGVQNLFVIYRTGGGLKGNISTGFLSTSVTGTAGLLAVTVEVSNYQPGSGGAERESVDEIRFNAPRFLRTNETATTEDDFDSLAGTYSEPGGGAVVRAKSRLTPAEEITVKVVISTYVLGTVPAGTPLEYFLLLPGAPIISGSVSVSYFVGGIARTVTDTDVGGGQSNLVGGSTIDSSATRFRRDQHDWNQDSPSGFLGDGSTISFAGTLSGPPVLPSSVVLHYTYNGDELIAVDDGSGNVVGNNIGTATIDYATGGVTIEFGDRAQVVSGNAETYDLNNISGGADVDLTLKIDGGGTQTITFSSGDPLISNFAAVTAAEAVDVLNAQLAAGSEAFVSGTNVGIRTDTYGSGGSVEVTGGPANNASDGFDFSTSVATGSDFPPDSNTVISYDYQSALRLVLLSAPDSGTDITISMETGPETKQLPSNNVEVYTWSFDADQKLVAPSDGLQANLKAFLDLKRVIGTSVEVLRGFNVRVNFYLTVVYNPAIAQSETQARIVSALEGYFESVANVQAGVDVPLAALYDVLWPVFGVDKVVIQDLGLRVPVGVGDGSTAIFQHDTETPGQYLDETRLPMVTGIEEIKVYRGGTQIGDSDGASPDVALSGSGLLSGSTVNKDDGEFDLRLDPVPDSGEEVWLEYKLDEVASANGAELWNLDIAAWEIAVLGDIFVNDSKVN